MKKYVFPADPRRIFKYFFSNVFLASTPPFIGLRRSKVRSDTSEKVFLNELQAASDKLASTEDVIFFVPNATSVEIQALIELARIDSPLLKARWVLLYRRSLFSGYPSTHAQQFQDVDIFKFDLARLKLQAPNLKVIFSTDTKELTAQYNMIGVYKFETLPVPVDPVMKIREGEGGSRITIGYLGDVRDEKGYHHIKPIVETINENSQTGSVAHFLLQSDFNIPGGEALSREAVSALEAARFPNVDLVYGPFDNDDYEALLSRIDFILAPYDAENYCARSSGIFMEAICYGMPVAVPAGSWMANMVEKDRCQLFEAEIAKLEPAQITTIDTDKEARCNVGVPEGTGYISVRFTSPTQGKAPIRVNVRYFSNGCEKAVGERSMVQTASTGSFFIILEKLESDRIDLQFEMLGDVMPLNLGPIEVSIFITEKKIKLNRGVIVFDKPETLPGLITGAVIDFDYHREAILELQRQFEDRYKPSSLVNAINKPR